MRWLVAPLVGQLVIALPIHAQTDLEIRRKCVTATDYQGCVESPSWTAGEPAAALTNLLDTEKFKSNVTTYDGGVPWDTDPCPEGKVMALKNEYGFFGGLKRQIPVGCMTPYEIEMINATEKAGRKPVTFPVRSSPKNCRTQFIGSQAFTTCY